MHPEIEAFYKSYHKASEIVTISNASLDYEDYSIFYANSNNGTVMIAGHFYCIINSFLKKLLTNNSYSFQDSDICFLFQGKIYSEDEMLKIIRMKAFY